MRIEPEISGISVVFLGSFNPAIFTPAWFALYDLLPVQAADNAELEVAHPGLTVFSTEWLQIQVTTDRFEASIQRDPYIRLRDLLLRVFMELLHHTPLTAFGINRHVHFRVKSPHDRDRIGGLLAPVEPWGRCKDRLGLDSEYGGMTSLTVSQFRPEGRPPGGQTNVTVEPSKQIADGRSGIYVRVNDHYAIGSNDINGREQLMSFLENGFELSIKHSDDIIDHIMSL